MCISSVCITHCSAMQRAKSWPGVRNQQKAPSSSVGSSLIASTDTFTKLHCSTQSPSDLVRVHLSSKISSTTNQKCSKCELCLFPKLHSVYGDLHSRMLVMLEKVFVESNPLESLHTLLTSLNTLFIPKNPQSRLSQEGFLSFEDHFLFRYLIVHCLEMVRTSLFHVQSQQFVKEFCLQNTLTPLDVCNISDLSVSKAAEICRRPHL